MRIPPASHAETPARDLCDGHLRPWIHAETGAAGWQIDCLSRRLAHAVVTISGGTVYSRTKDEWQIRIPQAALTVMVVEADTETLWCRLDTQHSDSCLLALVYAPWSIATVLRCPTTALPRQGQLSMRDVRATTRMGRTVRYLVPVFTPA
ncbi:hypothetical protein GCM10009733_029430 [Nonomuraea maheshkhaliensis]|uniref:AraC family transcriptional regulator n=1 Tax=Nonomuraea maheshkhaliensis TaxID=419590 RepID=A0ABN2F4U0_9ACTN